MSKHKKKKPTGTGRQMLAAENLPLALHDAGPSAAQDVVAHLEMNTTANIGAQDNTSRPPAAEHEVAPATVATATIASPDTDRTAAPDDMAAVPAASPDSVVEAPRKAHGSLGQRLRAAREAHGWSAEEVAGRLRLPSQTIHSLEAEQYERIGYGIYLRGYLTSYARLVDVPTILIEPVLRERSHAPPLVASGTISHSRYLYQRYSVSALYLILTGVIIVPAVLLAMRASLQPDLAQVTVLEPAPAPAAAAPDTVRVDSGEAASTSQSATAAAASPAAATGTTDTPLVASLAPFSALSRKEAPRADTAVVAAGTHSLKLALKESSWVEVVSASGEKLEYGLLPGGSVRSYASDKALEVRLGNCTGAEVEADGKPQDLTPYRHANVAHFKVFSAGESISHTD